MDSEIQRKFKSESHQTSAIDRKIDSHADFNQLYGDLCRKLLSTPVGEILPGVFPPVTSHHMTNATGSTSPSHIHPAFPTSMAMSSTQFSHLANFYNSTGLLMTPFIQTPEPLKHEVKDSNYTQPIKGARTHEDSNGINESPLPVPDNSAYTENMGSIDIEKLVEEFRMTLERYGVSQRFAARFIMQDTSQGNLSFLMDKGRNRKWEELSQRGRIPYLKMKAWLESKDQQMLTLDMLKHSQGSRQNNNRAAINRRERFTMFQLNVLCRLFEENSNPPMVIRNAVAERLGIPLDRVNVWFQNQRARGFPARKFLQQSLFENGTDSYFSVDVENMKDKINEVQDLSNVYQGTLDASVFKSETDQNGSSFVTGNSPNFTSTSSSCYATDTHVKSEPDETLTSHPLDLSSSSNSYVRNRLDSSSLVTHQHLQRETNRAVDLSSGVKCDFNQTESTAQNIFRDNVFQTNQSIKSVNSGAAKRKRGYVPQQYISANNTESLGSETGINDDTKRRKKAQSQAPETNYTYLFETSDIALEASNEDDNISKKESMNKFERTEDTCNPKSSGGNDGCFNSSVKHEASTSNYESDRDTDLNIESLQRTGKDEIINGARIIEEIPNKSVALFKAICANLAHTEGNSKNDELKEPDLD